MTICPKCETPLKSGQKVRGEFICDFLEEPGSVIHAVLPFEEIWLEHEICQYAQDGD